MSDEAHGTERERHVRETAARLGVADFVYSAPPVSKGAAFREVSGDGLLIVGQRGAVLQVKARAPESRDDDSPSRAGDWVRKNAAKAARQGEGTKRELVRRWRAGTPCTVTPVRAAGLPPERRSKYDLVVASDVSRWPVVVVVDHPLAAGLDLGAQPGVVWITVGDWVALQRRLRSVSATLTYIERILQEEVHVPLGHESDRYRALHAADEAFGSRSPSSTVPYLAHPDEFDELGADLFHDVMEKVWHDDGVLPWSDAADYRTIVEFLDVVPPTVQAHVGRWFFRKRSEIAAGRRRSSGIVRLDHRDRMVFGCSHFREWGHEREWLSEFGALTMLRHLHALGSGAPSDSVTLGVGALVEDRPPRRGVAYTFVMARGEAGAVEMPADLRRLLEHRYGVYDHAGGTVSAPPLAGSDPCPCMSGRPYEACCGRGTRAAG